VTRRLLATTLGLTVVVLLVLVVPFARTFREREEEDLLARVERDAVAIAFFVEDELDPLATDAGIDLGAVAAGYEARTGGRVVIVDATGTAVADSDPPSGEAGVGRDFSTRPEFARALAGEVDAGIRRSDTLGASFVFVAVPVASGGEVDGAVRITYPTAAVDDRVQRQWALLGGLSAVTLVTAAVLAVVLGRSVTRPLRGLQDDAAALGAGDLSRRARPDDGPPEVRALAGAFNRMASRLEELVTAQDHFVADASHELRTPLTALRLRLEALEPGDDVDAALAEVARMARLVDGLLALARADRPDAGSARAVDLAAFVEERREAWEPLAADADVQLEAAATTAGAALANPDRFAQVVDNLVANAIDASPAGSTVRLVALADGEAVEVHVVDQGPGLPAADRERAFDRFWRASATRSGAGDDRRPRFGGSGLGLAIVRKLVVADGGDVRLDEADGGGVDAVVRYPVASRRE
jgi:signal transduction histidine kinase